MRLVVYSLTIAVLTQLHPLGQWTLPFASGVFGPVQASHAQEPVLGGTGTDPNRFLHFKNVTGS